MWCRGNEGRKPCRGEQTQPKLDTDYPESNQFDVSKGRVYGRVLGAAVVGAV